MTSESYTCFSPGANPQKHHQSTKTLYDAGVWIGYLDNHAKSYQKLPSFTQLKSNARHFKAPFPPSIAGVPRDERHAVCHGCCGSDARLITLRDISYGSRSKAVILPLKTEGEEDLFCIMIPQPNDRSMPSLQAYRPYEITDDGSGKTFRNSFQILVLRNFSQKEGTVEAIQSALAPLPLDFDRENTISQKERSPEKLRTGPRKRMLHEIKDFLPLPKRQRSRRSDRSPIPRPLVQQPTPASREPSTPLTTPISAYRPTSSKGAILFGGSPTTASGPPAISNSVPAVSSGGPSLPSSEHKVTNGLTKEQRGLVSFNLTLTVDDGTEYEFVRLLDECESFTELLGLFRVDAGYVPEAVDVLDHAKVLRFTYQLPGASKKVLVLKVGNEVMYERLQSLLAKSSAWDTDPYQKVDVELRVLAGG